MMHQTNPLHLNPSHNIQNPLNLPNLFTGQFL